MIFAVNFFSNLPSFSRVTGPYYAFILIHLQEKLDSLNDTQPVHIPLHSKNTHATVAPLLIPYLWPLIYYEYKTGSINFKRDITAIFKILTIITPCTTII